VLEKKWKANYLSVSLFYQKLELPEESYQWNGMPGIEMVLITIQKLFSGMEKMDTIKKNNKRSDTIKSWTLI